MEYPWLFTTNTNPSVLQVTDRLKPQSDLKHHMNLCSHTVSEPETFHLQVILRGKGSFMKQVTHTFEQDVRRSLYELSEIIEHKSRKFLYDSNIHIGTLANKKKNPHISLY